MDQERKEPKAEGRFSESLRYLLYVAVFVFFLSCMTVLFLDHIEMKRRLAAMEDKMITDETLQKFCATSRIQRDTDERVDDKALLLRRKRELALSLQGLEKRLKVLEFR